MNYAIAYPRADEDELARMMAFDRLVPAVRKLTEASDEAIEIAIGEALDRESEGGERATARDIAFRLNGYPGEA